ncbi:MAG: hypothetical protein EXS31_08555 [Pedosphaera sp.]|nr:hypothetical protein [Pedosphaera sp.]
MVQTATVPPDAKYLSFFAPPSLAAVDIHIDDQLFRYTDMLALSGNRLFIEVSKWAGKPVHLKIVLADEVVTAIIDDILFEHDLGLSAPPLKASLPATAIGEPQSVNLSFLPGSGWDYFVEYRDALTEMPTWQALPGAPHNSGVSSDPLTNVTRFYRLRAVKRAG